MALVTAQLARDGLASPLQVAVALAAAYLLWRRGVGSAWLVLGAAAVGWAAVLVG
jgi:hypothetical protein